jgi:hypothetical protein
MNDAKRWKLRIAACALALTALVVQVPVIIALWWNFDPRLSCHRLLYWNEWITCLHGQSHLHILTTELAVAIWTIAGVGMALGRFLPWHISMLVPVGIAVALTWFLIDHWHQDFRPRTDPILSGRDIFNFSVLAGGLASFLVGPVAGAWLWGFCGRGRRRSLLRLSTVFDSAG